MNKLIKIEYRKLAKSKVFVVMLFLYVVSITALLFGVEAFINKVTSNASQNSPIPIPSFSLYSFPYIWHNLTYLTGFFKLLPALIVMVFVTAEYSHRTIRQHIINGISREHFFLQKVFFITAISLIVTFTTVISALILGFLHTDVMTFDVLWQKSVFVAALFLEIFAYSSMALFFAVLLRKSGLAIIAFAIYTVIAEPIIRFYLDDNIAAYFPMKRIGSLIDTPNTALMKLFGVNFRTYIEPSDVLVTILYTLLFLGATYLLIKKRDI